MVKKTKQVPIRTMQRNDIKAVVQLRMKYRSADTTLITRLGKAFNYDFTKFIFEVEPGACFVADDNGRIAAFSLGTSNYPALTKKLIKKFFWRFPLKTLIGQYKTWSCLGDALYLLRHSLKWADDTKSNEPDSRAAPVEMAVDLDYRRQGLGTRLMENTYKYFKKKGIKAVVLSTYKNDIPIVKLHTKMGAKPVRIYDSPTGKMQKFYKVL